MRKLLIICGPTATGKTRMGVSLAQKLNGEIVSADSRQVYKGIDIITGKDLPASSKFKVQSSKFAIENKKIEVGFREKDGIPVWLVDIVEPDYVFNVGEYSILAKKVIRDIWERGKLPIIVGGTGLYIRSIIDPLEKTIVPTNIKLREMIKDWNVGSLQNKLQEIDPERWEKMNQSDEQNPRRLVRAIEIAQWRETNMDKTLSYSALKTDSLLMIGLKSSTKYLFELIEKRIEERVKNGAIEEVVALDKRGYSWFLPALSATGCRKLKDYLDWKNTLRGAIKSWKLQECQLVRTQMVWYKKDQRIKWFDITEDIYPDNLISMVKEWYTIT